MVGAVWSVFSVFHFN